MLVGWYDGSDMTIYLNMNVIAGPTATTGNIDTSDYDLGIGWGPQIGGEYWNGPIAAIHLLERAVPEADLDRYFQRTRGIFGV